MIDLKGYIIYFMFAYRIVYIDCGQLVIMLSIDEIRERLVDRNLSIVAKSTNLSYMTVWKVKNGHTDGFSYRTIKTLSDYLERQ